MPSTEESDTSIDDRTPFVYKLDLAELDGKYIAGYANIANIIDNQDELVTLDALKQAWEQFKQDPHYALLMLHHQNIPVAKVVFEEVTDSNGRVYKSGVDNHGLFIVAQLREDTTIAKQVWRDIERGKLRGFSIGGKNLDPQPIQCDENRCYRILSNLELYEVSIVTRPANPASIFTVLKCDQQMNDTIQKLAKATEGFMENIIHEGIVKVSKTPDEDGVYELYSCTERGTTLCKDLSAYLATVPEIGRFKVTTSLDVNKEYVNILNLALLKPITGVLTRDVHVGSNASSAHNKPPTGEPKSTEREEINKNNTSQRDKLETETHVEPHENDVVKSMNSPNNLVQEKEVKKKVSTEPETQTQPTVNTVVAAPAEANVVTPVAPEPTPVAQPQTPTPAPTPAPVQQPEPTDAQPAQPTQTPTPQVQPQPTQPVTQPIQPQPAPPVQQPAPQPVMQTRGVQVTVEQMNQTGFDLASLTRVSQQEIDRIREQTERRR